MQVLFSDKFKRQVELGEVGGRDIMELVARITAGYNRMQQYSTIWVERFDRTNDPDFDLMTEVRVKLSALSTDLTLASRRFTYINRRAKDFNCMNIQIEKGDII